MGEVVALILLISFAVRLIRRFRNRNVARVGGEIGPQRSGCCPPPAPEGYSSVQTRTITLFTSSASPTQSSLKDFLRNGTRRQPTEMHIFRLAGCAIDVEIPAALPDYARIDAGEALAFLRELPDRRLVRRLQLSDEPSFLDPWVRKTVAPEYFLLGSASAANVIVLYRPTANAPPSQNPGLTLLHEWFHLLAFRSSRSLRKFARADRQELLPPHPVQMMPYGIRRGPAHEAWSDLGERLFGYDEAAAQEAALKSPRHTLILWRCVESVLKSAPEPFRSTRYATLQQRGTFFASDVAAKLRDRG